VKTFLVFLLLSITALVNTASAITAIDAGMDGKLYVSNAAGFKTFTAAGDSAILKSAWVPVAGWEQFVAWDVITGTGSDSVALDVVIQGLGPAGEILGSVHVDTITSAAGSFLVLPVGNTVVGFSYKVYVKAITGVGTSTILNRVYFGKRR
jgi:hypothetical protein